MRALLVALVVAAAGCVSLPEPGPATVDPAALPVPTLSIPALDAFKASVRLAAETGGEVTVFAAREADAFGRGALAAPTPVNLTLRPAKFLADDIFAEIDAANVSLPAIEFFEGEIAGRPDTYVRLSLAENWARGSIRAEDTTRVIRVAMNGNMPLSYRAPEAGAAAAGSAFTAMSEGDPIDGPSWEEQGCLTLVPPHTTPMTNMGAATETPILARLVLDSDAFFVSALGDETFPMMLAMVWEIDSIYAHEVGIRFEVAGLHANTDPEYYPDPVADAHPLDKLAEYWNPRTEVDRDIVHLFTGQRSNYAQAYCIGGAGVPEFGYSFTPLNWEAETTVFHATALAHEFGHLFSAHHHHGNHVETAVPSSVPSELPPVGVGSTLSTASPRWATLMIQGYTPGAKPIFSTVSKSVIRGWAENYLVGEGDGHADNEPGALHVH